MSITGILELVTKKHTRKNTDNMATLTKYLRLRQYIADRMLHHTSDDIPLMSERELCKTFNITRTTVRKALKIFISEGSIITKHGSGMYLKGTLRKNTIYAESPPRKLLYLQGGGRNVFLDNWHLHLLQKVCKYVKRNNFMMQFSSFTGEVGTEMEELEMYAPEAILWARPAEKMIPLIPEIRKKVPVCILFDSVRNDPFAVTMDYFQAGKTAALHFLRSGAENILYVLRPDSCSAIMSAFHAGWCSALEQDGGFHTVYLPQDSDFEKALGSFPSGKIDAVFTHSAFYPGIRTLLKKIGRNDCPVMVDSFDYVCLPDTPQPRWVIDLYPEIVFETAVKNIATALQEAHSCQSETVFQAEIVELKKT